MKRKAIIIIIIVVVIILVSISGWLIYKKYIKKSNNSGNNDVYNPNDIYIPNLSGSSSGGYSPSSFPIKKGMSGQQVSDIQTAINKKCNKGLVVDGKFGPLTESGLNSCYGTTTVSEALYTQMKFDTGAGTGCKEGEYKGPLGCMPISGGITTPSSGFSKGDMIYGKIPNILLYKNPDGSTSFGKIASSQNLNNPIGSYLSSYKEFSEIMVTTNYTGVTGGSIQSTPVRAFVYTSLIKKK